MNVRKNIKNQQGMAHVLMVVLIIVVIAVIAGVGYAVANKKKTPTNSSTTSSGTSATASTGSASAAFSSCMTTYKDANICNFASSSTDFSKTSYKATLTVTGDGSSGGTLTLENDGKGNTSLTTTSSGGTLNTIELNGNTYVQTGGTGSVWTEYPSGTSGAPTSDPTSDMNIGVGTSGITFKYIDTEACGSLTCYKYQVSDSTMPTTTQYVWFDKSKYQLQEWEATSASSGTTDMKITYQAVTISAPSPVQQFSSAY